MSRLFKVALLQLVSLGRNREANLQKGDEFCRVAASAGADLTLFPEMWSIGYQAFDPERPDDRRAWLSLRLRPKTHSWRTSETWPRSSAWPYVFRGAPGLALFDRRGKLALIYSKVHLGPWGPPDNACAAGDDFPVCALDTRLGVVRIGAMICFDREFPEAARMLMLNGAELILTPNACDLDDRKSGVGDVRIAQRVRKHGRGRDGQLRASRGWPASRRRAP